MPTYGYVSPKPDEGPPTKAPEPKSFADFEFVPAVQFHATSTEISVLARVLKRHDASGACSVAHLKLNGTAVFVYQAEDHAKTDWLVYVDMHGCVEHDQLPTKVGASVAKYFTTAPVSWENKAVDTIYRRRAREHAAAVAARVAEAIKKANDAAKKRLETEKPKRSSGYTTIVGSKRGTTVKSAAGRVVHAAAKKAEQTRAAPAKKAAAKVAAKPAAKPAAKKSA